MSLSTTVGTKVRLRVDFHDGDTGERVDPTSVVFTVKPPTGATRTIDGVRQGLGSFTAEVLIDQQGTWVVGADGKGAYEASVEDKVFVAEQLLQR